MNIKPVLLWTSHCAGCVREGVGGCHGWGWGREEFPESSSPTILDFLRNALPHCCPTFSQQRSLAASFQTNWVHWYELPQLPTCTLWTFFLCTRPSQRYHQSQRHLFLYPNWFLHLCSWSDPLTSLLGLCSNCWIQSNLCYFSFLFMFFVGFDAFDRVFALEVFSSFGTLFICDIAPGFPPAGEYSALLSLLYWPLLLYLLLTQWRTPASILCLIPFLYTFLHRSYLLLLFNLPPIGIWCPNP